MFTHTHKTSGFTQTILSVLGKTAVGSAAYDFLDYIAGLNLKISRKPATDKSDTPEDWAAYEAIREKAGGLLDCECGWYSFHQPKDIAELYDFVPVSAGVPDGLNPFRAAIRFDEDGKLVGHSEGPVIPVFKKGMACRVNGNVMTFETLKNQPLLGYLVRRGHFHVQPQQSPGAYTEYRKGRMWRLPEPITLLEEVTQVTEENSPDETVAY